MRIEAFHAVRFVELFRTRKIATMPELKAALGTDVDMTVFRKLKELGYRTSYSHRGGYYTLNEIALFNDLGLWSFRAVWFSRYGTLVRTCEAFVTGSEAGYFAEELDNVLHVETKAALLHLFRAARVSREEVSGRYLYCSSEPGVREHRSSGEELWKDHGPAKALDTDALATERNSQFYPLCALLGLDTLRRTEPDSASSSGPRRLRRNAANQLR